MNESFEKQGYEEFTIEGDFSKNMEVGETINAGALVLAEDNAGSNVAATVTDQATIAVVGQGVQVLVRGGTENLAPYKVTFRCVTSVNHKWEIDVDMKIKEN